MKTLLLLALFVSSVAHARQSLTPAQLDDFGKVIRLNGFECSKAADGNYQGQTEYGMQFQIHCNNYAQVFEVVLTPNGGFKVKPWSER